MNVTVQRNALLTELTGRRGRPNTQRLTQAIVVDAEPLDQIPGQQPATWQFNYAGITWMVDDRFVKKGNGGT